MATLKLPKGSEPKKDSPPREANVPEQYAPTPASPINQHKKMAGA